MLISLIVITIWIMGLIGFSYYAFGGFRHEQMEKAFGCQSEQMSSTCDRCGK